MSYQPYPARPSSTSALAIASLVCGIAGWTVLPFIGGIVAIICGHMARGEIRRAPPGSMEGNGMAVAGLVLGYAQMALFVLVIVAIVAAIMLGLSAGSWH